MFPRGWSHEPATQAGCEALPPSDSGLLVRHPADFTIVLRALRWRGSPPGAARGLQACRGQGPRRETASPAGAAPQPAYAFRVDRLGVPVAVQAVLVTQDGVSLLLELEAPVAKLPAFEALFARWVREAPRGIL